MPQSLCVLLNTECPSWHSHGHTRRNARNAHTHTHTHTHCCIHRVSSEWSLQHHERFGRLLFSACLFVSRVLIHCFPLSCSVFTPTSSVGGPQRPVLNTEAHFRLASREDGPLWLLYCGETMLSDILESVAFVLHFTSPQCFRLFVFSPDVSQPQIESSNWARLAFFWRDKIGSIMLGKSNQSQKMF